MLFEIFHFKRRYVVAKEIFKDTKISFNVHTDNNLSFLSTMMGLKFRFVDCTLQTWELVVVYSVSHNGEWNSLNKEVVSVSGDVVRGRYCEMWGENGNESR